MRFLWILIVTPVLLWALPQAAAACGVATKCKVKDRHYYIAMPEGHTGKKPIAAIVFAHGLQGTARGTIQNPRLRRVASELGVALIGVKSLGRSWALRNSPSGTARTQRIEMAYFDDVVADATARFSIDPKRIVMAGASTGGMVTWTLACERSDIFAAFIPMSGTFWRPVPPNCNGPVSNIVHFHGDKDQTVPLEGRPVAGTHQGSVTGALQMYRRYGDFSALRSQRVGDLRCKVSKNGARNILNFCLYDGKHSFRSSNIAVAWRMLKAAGQI